MNKFERISIWLSIAALTAGMWLGVFQRIQNFLNPIETYMVQYQIGAAKLTAYVTARNPEQAVDLVRDKVGLTDPNNYSHVVIKHVWDLSNVDKSVKKVAEPKQ